MSVGNYYYVAVCRRGGLGGARRFGAQRGRRHIVAAARLQLVTKVQIIVTLHKKSYRALYTIDVKNVFLRFLFRARFLRFLTFFIFPTFFIF